jgi:putative salt-induced outer membrane protein YdiY
MKHFPKWISGALLMMLICLVTPLYAQDAASATAQEDPDYWSFELAANLAGKTGNTDEFGAGAKITATRKDDKSTLINYLEYLYAKENGEKSSEELLGGFDYEHLLNNEVSSWYIRLDGEYDRVEGIDFRGIGAAGYGHYILKEEDQTLRGRVGLNYRYESRDGGQKEEALGFELGLKHWWQINDRVVNTNEITWIPTFEDPGIYLLRHESKVDIDLNENQNWKISLGIKNDYNSDPAPDKRELDTEYYARLVYAW